jgi:hypothetical protein
MSEQAPTYGACDCTSERHWEMLNQLTVIVFTRNRPREVSRLLRSLSAFPCFVDVWDNGQVELPAELQALSDRQSYSFREGHWAHNWRSAASHLRTEFVCLVDDDGLLQPHGAAAAICALHQDSDAVAAEGQVANFVVRQSRAILLKGTESPPSSAHHRDPLTRWSGSLQSFSESPWYAVHRSATFVETFSFAADVEELSTSRNVSTPLFIAMTSARGPLAKSRALVSLREDSLPPHDQHSMDLWIGDWLADNDYRDEVDAVISLTRHSLAKGGMTLSDREQAIGVFREAMARHAHVEPAARKGLVAALGQVIRPLRGSIRKARIARREERVRESLKVWPGLSMSYISAMPHSTVLDVGPIHWDSRDVRQTLLALDVDEAIVVDRPRELRSQAYIHSLQTGVRSQS